MIEAALLADSTRLQATLLDEARDMPDVVYGVATLLGRSLDGADPLAWLESLPRVRLWNAWLIILSRLDMAAEVSSLSTLYGVNEAPCQTITMSCSESAEM